MSHSRGARTRVPVLTLLLLALAAPLAGAADSTPPAAPSSDPDALQALRDELSRTRAEYDARLADLERRLALAESEAASPAPPALAAPTANGSRTGLSNPDIGVVGDFRAAVAEQPDGSGRNFDFEQSEVEVSFHAAVDPYVRFDAYAVFHGEEDSEVLYPSGADEPPGDSGGSDLIASIEEAYVTSLSLPAGLQLRGGRFRQRLGPYSGLHPHDQPFADEPTALEAFLGEDLVDDGAELGWLLPTPFYWELTGAVTRGPSESPTFGRDANADRFLYTAHSKLYFDASAHSSWELGLSFAQGPGGNEGARTSTVRGVDLSYKWRPNSRQGITWVSEWLERDLPVWLEPPGVEPYHVGVRDRGAYTYLEGRVAKRHRVGLRVDWLDYDDDFFAGTDVDDRRDVSLIYQFWPSEFQALKVQGKRTWDDLVDDGPVDSLQFEWVWIMGAHGAHPF